MLSMVANLLMTEQDASSQVKVLAAGGDGKISRLTEQSVGLYIVYLHDFE